MNNNILDCVFCFLVSTGCLLVLTGSVAVSAQESEEGLYLLYGDEDMVSIATGMRQPVVKAPSTATIITADDIKAMGAITIDEVLEAVPGLHVVPSTLDRMNPVYVIRGIYTGFNPQVLFMLNGNRITSSLFTGGISVNSKMNVENISRIEVIRGPGSAIYGADAYAGVINIVTKDASELNGMHSGIRGGSFSTKDAWVQYGGALNMDWDVMFHIEHAQQDADTSRIVTSDFQSVFDAFFATSASLAPSYLDQRYEQTTYNIHVNSEQWNFGVDGWIIRDRGLGAGIIQAIDHDGFDDFGHFIATAAYQNKNLVKDWEFSGNLGYQEADINSYFNIFPPGAVLPIGTDGNFDSPVTPINPPLGSILFPDGMIGNPSGTSSVIQGSLTALYEGWEAHSLRINLGSKREEVKTNEFKNFGPGIILDNTVPSVDGTLTDVSDTPFVFLPERSRTISYLSLQDVWQMIPDWTLTAGIRYDDYSDFGSTTNPRIALVWNTSQHMTSKILYGRAFRAPSFSELYAQNNPIVLGNPNLEPETIDTLELALAWHPSTDLTTGISIYQFRTKDMIDFVDNPDGSKTAQNVKSLEGEGFELELDWDINNSWDIVSNYAWQSTENRATGIQEAFIPERQFYLDARWSFMTDWEASTQINWISDRDRVNAISSIRENVDGYTWVNLTLRRSHVGKHWEFAATIKNAFAEDAVEPSDGRIDDNYPLNERSYFVEGRYSM